MDEATLIRAETHPNKSEWETSFLESVRTQHDKSGGLSPKQWGIVSRIAGSIKDETPVDNGFDAVITMLDLAGTKLKYPSFTVDGIKFQRINKGKNEGAVSITIKVTREYIGRINRNGSVVTFKGWQNGYDDTLDAIRLDPVAALREAGHAHGRCAFCHLPLNDERSTTNGYGPVCAKNFGLPWAVVQARDILTERDEKVETVHEETMAADLDDESDEHLEHAGPQPGTLAHTAKVMVELGMDGDEADRWKDDMKQEMYECIMADRGFDSNGGRIRD